MKLRFALLIPLISEGVHSFAPNVVNHALYQSPSKTARSFGVDPSVFQDLSQAFSSISISDAVDAVTSVDVPAAASAVVDTVTSVDVPAAASVDVVESVGDVVDAVATDNGWFGFLVGPIEGLLFLIHNALTGLGMSENSWGLSIIALTALIKLATLPLTKQQLESTNKMQALQPTVKELQAKYQSNPEVMNQKVAEIYQQNDVNPLAGCLPSLAQIPIFIGLYRAVLNLAQEDKLNEPFLWLPNLEGPTYGADPSEGSSWLFSNWVDGVPSLGWDDTIAFLILPVILVVSQFASMELMQPKDPAARQDNVVLKILPVMIGWFSLNVPAALCVYWVVNNFITTSTTLAIRNSMPTQPVAAASSMASTAAPESTIFAPNTLREKPSGFGASSVSGDEVKPITAIDAEVIEKVAPPAETEETAAVSEAEASSDSTGEAPKKKKGKRRKGKKKKKN